MRVRGEAKAGVGAAADNVVLRRRVTPVQQVGGGAVDVRGLHHVQTVPAGQGQCHAVGVSVQRSVRQAAVGWRIRRRTRRRPRISAEKIQTQTLIS